MANIKVINEEGSIKCLRFGDDTRPLCHVSGQLGHLCQPCGREDQAAHILFESGTPQARREILRHEHNKLRLANIFIVARTLVFPKNARTGPPLYRDSLLLAGS